MKADSGIGPEPNWSLAFIAKCNHGDQKKKSFFSHCFRIKTMTNSFPSYSRYESRQSYTWARLQKNHERLQSLQCKPAKTPVASDAELIIEVDCPISDIELYRSIVGSLLYLCNNSRPDLSFHVGLLSRYADKPAEIHLLTAKRILRYCKGTINSIPCLAHLIHLFLSVDLPDVNPKYNELVQKLRNIYSKLKYKQQMLKRNNLSIIQKNIDSNTYTFFSLILCHSLTQNECGSLIYLPQHTHLMNSTLNQRYSTHHLTFHTYTHSISHRHSYHW